MKWQLLGQIVAFFSLTVVATKRNFDDFIFENELDSDLDISKRIHKCPTSSSPTLSFLATVLSEFMEVEVPIEEPFPFLKEFFPFAEDYQLRILSHKLTEGFLDCEYWNLLIINSGIYEDDAVYSFLTDPYGDLFPWYCYEPGLFGGKELILDFIQSPLDLYRVHRRLLRWHAPAVLGDEAFNGRWDFYAKSTEANIYISQNYLTEAPYSLALLSSMSRVYDEEIIDGLDGNGRSAIAFTATKFTDILLSEMVFIQMYSKIIQVQQDSDPLKAKKNRMSLAKYTSLNLKEAVMKCLAQESCLESFRFHFDDLREVDRVFIGAVQKVLLNEIKVPISILRNDFNLIPFIKDLSVYWRDWGKNHEKMIDPEFDSIIPSLGDEFFSQWVWPLGAKNISKLTSKQFFHFNYDGLSRQNWRLLPAHITLAPLFVEKTVLFMKKYVLNYIFPEIIWIKHGDQLIDRLIKEETWDKKLANRIFLNGTKMTSIQWDKLCEHIHRNLVILFLYMDPSGKIRPIPTKYWRNLGNNLILLFFIEWSKTNKHARDTLFENLPHLPPSLLDMVMKVILKSDFLMIELLNRKGIVILGPRWWNELSAEVYTEVIPSSLNHFGYLIHNFRLNYDNMTKEQHNIMMKQGWGKPSWKQSFYELVVMESRPDQCWRMINNMWHFIVFIGWIVCSAIGLLRVNQHEHPSLLPTNGWNWYQLFGIYPLVHLVNFVLNQTGWLNLIIHDQSATSFLQVFTLVLSHAMTYLVIQLLSRHWNSHGLRKNLPRVEWRSIMGLTLFGSLSDLVFLTGDADAPLEMFPMLVVQMVILATCLHRVLQLMRQTSFFLSQLQRSSAPAMQTKLESYQKYQVYHVSILGVLMFHMGSLVIQWCLVMGGAGGLLTMPLRPIIAWSSQGLFIVYYVMGALLLAGGYLH